MTKKARPLITLFRNILLLVVVVYSAALYYVWQRTLDDAEINLTQMNSVLTQGVRTTLKGHELILRGLGGELVELGALESPEKGRRLIENMHEIDPGMVGFGLARPDGQLVLVSTIKSGVALPNLTESPETKASFNDVIESKRLRTGRPYFFKPLSSWVVPIRAPVFDENGKIVAVMTAAYKMENASVAWSNAELPPNTVLALVREDGYLIFRQPLPPGQREQIFEKFYGKTVASSTMELVSSLNKEKSFVRFHAPVDGRDFYAAYNYIAEYGLHTAAMLSRNAVILNWVQRITIPTILFALFLLGGNWAFRRARQRQIKADAEIQQLSSWQEAILNGASSAIVSADPKGTIISYNSTAQRMLGYTAEEMIGKATPAIFHDKDEMNQRAAELSQEFGKNVEPGFEVFTLKPRRDGVEEREWTFVRKDGSTFPVYLTVTPLYGNGREIIGYMGIAADVSEKKAIQKNLRASEGRYQTLFDSAGDAIFLMQEDRFIDCNEATLKMFGCKREDIVGSKPQIYSPEFQPDGRLSSEKALEKIHAAFKGEQPVFEWLHQKLDGTPFNAEVRLSIVEISNQPHLLAVVRDITERKRFEDELIFQARHDSLTGLPNRVSLNEAFSEFMKEESGQKQSLALLLIDLDRFKEINDTLGHHIGDEVLMKIGPRLNQVCMNCSCMIARLGGDEFAILLDLDESADEVVDLANNIVKALSEPISIRDIKLSIGASIGIAFYPEHGKNGHEVLRAADVAMYRAKRLSLGTMVYDDSFDDYSPQRLRFASELTQAVENKQLVLHYQPKIDIASGKTVSFEALVRWQHPTQGLLFPDAFIDLVEMSEVVHAFTNAVIELAVSEKKKLNALGYEQPVAINLSARNLLDDTCLNVLEASLKDHDLSSNEIEFELTESALMHDPESAITILDKFKAMGVNIAIDDFGTGYSSLAYLRQLPVSALKIDRHFVMDMIGNPQDRTIVESTIALAHSLDLKVVAEGVENDETLALLQGMDCDMAQGYGICRPKPLTDLIDWLSS